MEKKGKIIIGVVAVVLVLLVAGFLLLGNSSLTMQGDNSQIKIPGNYSLDDKGVATAGDTSVMFTGVMAGNSKNEADRYNALKQNGKEAGYENVSKSDKNGYTVYEFAAYPNKLKNVSTDVVSDGSTSSWMTFTPYLPFGENAGVHHYRMLSFVKGDDINYLTVYTKDPNTSLYTSEIDTIINSIGPIEK